MVAVALGAQHGHSHASDGQSAEEGPQAATHAEHLAGKVGQEAAGGAGDEVQAPEDGCDVACAGDGVTEDAAVVRGQGIVQRQLQAK